jgi:hypothetical protein
MRSLASYLGSMRIALLVLVLVACGDKRRDSEPARAPQVVDEDEKCDPSESRVCVGHRVVVCEQGKLGRALRTCREGCRKGKCLGACAEGAALIYVVDDNDHLLSFDPRKLPSDPFHTIGKLRCESTQTPFSMAVDRMGIAWVLYSSGKIYRVSIIDAKCSQGATPEGAPQLFGMGFVTDGPDAKTEKLFVAGFEDPRFAQLDIAPKRPAWKTVGELATTKKNPELSGTGGGKLFGFFPEDGDDAFVSEIDRETGKLVGKRMKVGSPKGRIEGWAFAHWGGDYYVFVTIDGNSRVYVIDGKTSQSKLVRENVPMKIVGAGVSTCAPLLEQPT